VPDDGLIDEGGDDDAQVCLAGDECFLEAGRLHQAGRDDDRLAGNSHGVADHGSHADSKPQLEPGRLSLAEVVPFQGRGQLPEHLVHHPSGGNGRRYDRQKAVAAILRSRARYVLKGSIRHAEEGFSDDAPGRVIAVARAESDYIGEKNSAVFADQRGPGASWPGPEDQPAVFMT